MSKKIPKLCDSWPDFFSLALQEKFHPNVLAIILYGSWLRGKRDTLPDFYVILDSYSSLPSRLERLGNRILKPNVYSLLLHKEDQSCAAKYATLTLKDLISGIDNDFHPYLWARFSQPNEIVFSKDNSIYLAVNNAFTKASERMIAATIPMLESEFSLNTLWETSLTLTYKSELRSEDPKKARELVSHYAKHFEMKTDLIGPKYGLSKSKKGTWVCHSNRSKRYAAAVKWKLRQHIGTLLSLARLTKAAFTFNEPLDYILWKVERHTGVKKEASSLQKRHPLIFSWGLLWKIYRKGGFK
jgi:hypothetical protein